MRERGQQPSRRMHSGLLVASAAFALACGAANLWTRFGPLTLSPSPFCDSPIYDFGEARAGGTVSHRFVLRNRGMRELVIRRVASGCQCTTAHADEVRIAPFSSASIDATLSLKGTRGATRKRIAVITNAPSMPVLRLLIQGLVVSHFSVKPDTLLLSRSYRQAPAHGFIEIRAAWPDVHFGIVSVESDSAMICLSTETREAGKAYRLRVDSVREWSRTQGLARVLVRTDHPAEPLIVIPVMLRSEKAQSDPQPAPSSRVDWTRVPSHRPKQRVRSTLCLTQSLGIMSS